ncbi:hypothetical protein ACQJ8Q_02095 [Helicobacter pylori]
MFSKSVCHFLIAWHAPYNVGLPHKANLWGVRYFTTNPLKTPLDRTRYAWQSFTPHYDHSINKAYLYWIENRAI